MSIKLALNGFGRIGRLAFRQIIQDDDFEVVAINDLTSPDMLAYLLKHDSSQRGFAGHEISNDDKSITVDGKTIPIYAIPDAHEAPWGDLGIDIVLECTGFYASREKSQAHLDAGAKKVLINAPAGKDVPTIVYGVNHEVLKKEDIVVSGASCTTNCLAPMAKALNDYKEIKSGYMTTIHAYTPDQMLLDGPHRKGDFRRARAAGLNIVPASTGAAKAIGLVLPVLEGKLDGSAQRVPVPSGSSTILDAVVKSDEEITVEKINAVMKAAESPSFGYTEEPIVSSDIIGITQGSLFDATQTMVQKVCEHQYLVRVVAWYDNENGYTSQLIRTLKYMMSL